MAWSEHMRFLRERNLCDPAHENLYHFKFSFLIVHAPSHNCGKTNEKKRNVKAIHTKYENNFLGLRLEFSCDIPHKALIWWRFIKCTFHFDRVCMSSHTQTKYVTNKTCQKYLNKSEQCDMSIYVFSGNMCVMLLKIQFLWWWTTFSQSQKNCICL